MSHVVASVPSFALYDGARESVSSRQNRAIDLALPVRKPPNIDDMSYRDKLAKPGPRRLLACDGGGIRGMISIEVLACMESELPRSSGNSKLVLADYFDYVAGTSTGAIIATLIALRCA
jgi:hypothetical protein